MTTAEERTGYPHWYQIGNRITGETKHVQAYSAQEACQKLGWLIGNCWVRRAKGYNSKGEPIW
jgi:hypothetical protein